MPLKNLIFIAISLVCLKAFPSDQDTTFSQLTNFLKEQKLDKVYTKLLGPLIIIDGEVDAPYELERIEKIVYGLQNVDPKIAIQSLVQLSPQVWTRLAEQIEKEISSPNIIVRVVNYAFILEGVAENEFEAEQSLETARIYLGNLGGIRSLSNTNIESSIQKNTIQIVDRLRVRSRKPKSSKQSPQKK